MTKEKEKNKESDAIFIQTHLEKVEKELSTALKGKIIDIVRTTSKIYFKDKGIYNEKLGFMLVVKVESQLNERAEFTQFMSLPEKTTGLLKTNVYAFKQKYGKYPELNMMVDVYIDENGFYKIQY
jgi:hypothetical protein